MNKLTSVCILVLFVAVTGIAQHVYASDVHPGSFASGTLLTGVEFSAPSNEALPVEIVTTDNFKTPNGEEAVTTKGCVIFGSAFMRGDSRRVFIRAEKVTCPANAGESREMAVKGHIVDKDGIIGLKVDRLKSGEISVKAVRPISIFLTEGFKM
jgi:hypothetical protein